MDRKGKIGNETAVSWRCKIPYRPSLFPTTPMNDLGSSKTLFLDDAELLKSFTHNVVSKWTDMATAVIVVYEWLITIDMEIRLVWYYNDNDDNTRGDGKKGTLVTNVLYFVNRYGVVIDLILNYLRSYDVTVGTCRTLIRFTAATTVIGLYLSDYILVLRVCAVWKMNKIVILILATTYIATFIYVLTQFYLMLRPAEFFTLLPSGGCFADIQGSTLWIDYMLLLIYDIAMLVLMGYPTIKEYKFSYGRTEFMRRVYVEGVVFYVFLLLVDIVSLILQRAVPDNIFLFVMPARMLRSILASRVLLHIREYSSREVRRFNTTEVTNGIRFN